MESIPLSSGKEGFGGIINISTLFDIFLSYWWVLAIFLFFSYLVRKYSDGDIFGLRIETGDFGGGKTYNNTLETQKYSNDGFFCISNIRNEFIDLKFDSRIDLQRIFAYLMEYARITNTQDFIELGFRPIVFNVDEAHNYFFSRTFAENIDSTNIMVLTQVRKRNILATFITQELAQLDIFLRRLTTGIVKRYYSGFGFIRFYKIFYVPDPATTNLSEEGGEGVQVIKKGLYFAPTFLLFLSKIRKKLVKEKYVSKIIVGYTDLLNDMDFMEFLQLLYPIESEHGKEFWKVYKITYGNKQFKTKYENELWVNKERERIEEEYKLFMLQQKKDRIKKYRLTHTFKDWLKD